MTQPANVSSLALYLGESYATARIIDADSLTKKASKKSAPLFEKSVFLPQVSLKTFLNQMKIVAAEKEIKSVYVVTSYMDRLKSFRLGGSVVQVLPEGFENSYAAGHTHYLSLAAPSLIVGINQSSDLEYLKKEMVRLRKINTEINKVVFQLPENLVTHEQRTLIQDFFTEEKFKIFNCEKPSDLNQIRRTLLNAGSEGTKEEILSEIKETFGEETLIQFWVKDRFQSEFENIDLYWSSSYFLKYFLQQQKNVAAFYFDFEKWSYISSVMAETWISPWGPIAYDHPIFENFEIDPFAELTLDSIGQLIVSENNVQHEPGPFMAGRSVKALVLDCFYDELKLDKRSTEVFSQLNSASLQQKIENHFQILEKSQTLEATELSREEVKKWIRSKLMTWMQLRSADSACTVFGDLSFLLQKDASASQLKLNPLDFNWMPAITEAIKAQGSL
jgi:hypothetical protein